VPNFFRKKVIRYMFGNRILVRTCNCFFTIRNANLDNAHVLERKISFACAAFRLGSSARAHANAGDKGAGAPNLSRA
jgi:hypothetical protein